MPPVPPQGPVICSQQGSNYMRRLLQQLQCILQELLMAASKLVMPADMRSH